MYLNQVGLNHAEIYKGKTDESDDPLGNRILRNALKVCHQSNTHSLYFDNFFSSYQLLVYLNQVGFRAPGTMRKDRIMKCPLTDVKDKKKKERGSYDFRSSGKIEIVRWNDNAVVTLGSNANGVEPLGNAKRWMKGKGRENIPQPAVIYYYNKGMGGLDLLDRALSNMRRIIRGK